MRTMRVFAFVCAVAASAAGQTVDTVILRAALSPANEVPPVTGVQASGSATVYLHLSRTAGAITSGVVDFDVSYDLAGSATFVGLHIHEGPAGQNAGIVVGTDLSANNPVSHAGGAGRVFRPVAVTDRALLERIVNRPEGFYANMHTSVNPGGVMRGQLARAEMLVLRTVMSPLNEIPAIPNLDASGGANIVALAVRDASGQIVSGSVDFDISYRFTGGAEATGLHIHNGPAGINAGVVIGTDLNARTPISVSGRGSIFRTVEVASGPALEALRGLFVNPRGYYANLHTTVNTGGAIRGQLQFTGPTTLRRNLSPANEMPPIAGLEAQAAATITAHVTRDHAGEITSGTVIFDLTHQFPPNTEFTGLHIHDAPAGQNSGVVISSGLSRFVSVSGAGNIYRVVNITPEDTAALAALNGLLANPENYYVNLHTAIHTGGAVRAQLGDPVRAPPLVNAGGIIAAALDPALTSAAPGGLISLFGANLAKTAADASGMDSPVLPIIINGTDVRIGGQHVPLLYVSANQINAQVPFELAAGNAQVFVVRSGVFSAPVSLAVRAAAPAIFALPSGAAVLKNQDLSLVSADNPAAAGDILLIFCTGLGVVRPPATTGQPAPIGPIALTQAQAAVTIGGRTAEVLGSALTPGFVGLYQVAVRMPEGVPPGRQPIVITAADQSSNAPTMAVR